MLEGRYSHLMLIIPDEASKRVPFELAECKTDKDIVLREVLMFLSLRKLYFKIYPMFFNETIENRFKTFHSSHESSLIKLNSVIKLEGRVLHQCHLVKGKDKKIV